MVQQVDRGKVRVGSHHPRVLPATKGLKHDGRSARLRVPRRPRAPKVVPAQPKQTGALARLPEPCVVRSARHRPAPEDLASLTDLRVREDVRRMVPQAALEDCDGASDSGTAISSPAFASSPQTRATRRPRSTFSHSSPRTLASRSPVDSANRTIGSRWPGSSLKNVAACCGIRTVNFLPPPLCLRLNVGIAGTAATFSRRCAYFHIPDRTDRYLFNVVGVKPRVSRR